MGEGWHEEYGGPHAEVNAIRSAGDAARGATAYVSLEPCSHHGQTPPCSESLLKAGVARVVFGASEPGDETGGGGELMEQAGVEVVGPATDVRTFHEVDPAFFYTTRYQRPYLALKLAVSLDGRIAARAGERTPLTGDDANREVHRLRSGFDAVLVGGETARVDDPLLTVRYGLDPRIRDRSCFCRAGRDTQGCRRPGGDRAAGGWRSGLERDARALLGSRYSVCLLRGWGKVGHGSDT